MTKKVNLPIILNIENALLLGLEVTDSVGNIIYEEDGIRKRKEPGWPGFICINAEYIIPDPQHPGVYPDAYIMVDDEFDETLLDQPLN